MILPRPKITLGLGGKSLQHTNAQKNFRLWRFKTPEHVININNLFESYHPTHAPEILWVIRHLKINQVIVRILQIKKMMLSSYIQGHLEHWMLFSPEILVRWLSSDSMLHLSIHPNHSFCQYKGSFSPQNYQVVERIQWATDRTHSPFVAFGFFGRNWMTHT